MVIKEQREVVDGPLVLRSSLDGRIRILSLSGELDLANATTVASELTEALLAADAQVVVDLSELEFIDSTGIAVLVGAVGRCDGARNLRFVPSRAAAVNRVLALTGVAEKMPLLGGGSVD